MMARAASILRNAVIVLALFAGSAPALAQDAAGEVVLIPNRVIYPGETIVPAVLRKVTLAPDRRKPDAVATRAAQLDGKVARRTLLPGHYIPVNAIRDAWLVERGTPVQVLFVAGSLTIMVTAVTLESGAEGDLVKVRNTDSGKIFSGMVMADGTVRVGA